MPDSEVTLGEVARSLAGLEGRMNAGFEAMTKRFDNLEFVPRREYEVRVAALDDDVKKLEESKQWMQRTLVAAVLIAVLSPAVQLLMSR